MASTSQLKNVLSNALQMAKNHPTVFLPRIILSIIWSILWLWLLGTLQTGLAAAQQQLTQFSIAVLILTPLQVWVFNMYTCLVETAERGTYKMLAATKSGLRKLPHGLAAFLSITAASIIPLTAGSTITAIGINQQHTGIIVLGIAVGLTLLLLIMAAAYLIPPAVVLGKDGFITNMKTGITASYSHSTTVIGLTFISLALFVATALLQGILQTLGAISFILGRLIAAIVGTYIILVNPELYIQAADDSN